MDTASQRLTSLIRTFPALTKPLNPTDDWYVKDLHLEGDGQDHDPVAAFASQLAIGYAPMVTLFSGLIGTGKSTELLRLQKILSDKYQQRSFILNMAEYVNLNTPIQISDLLVSIVAALSDLVEKETGVNPVKVNSKVADFYHLLASKIEFKDIEVSAWGLKIKGTLKRDIVLKEKIQALLNNDLDKLFSAAIHAFDELKRALQNRYANEDSYILILDSLEQIQDVEYGQSTVKHSLKILYSQFLDQLYVPGFKVVYSVPSYLTNILPQLAQRIGSICRLTNVHIFQPRTRELDTEGGIAKLLAIITVRTKDIAPLNELIDADALTKLMQTSGGDLRTFFMMVREAALYELSADIPRLPIKLSIVNSALKKVRNSQGIMTDVVLKRLAHIDEHHLPDANDEQALDALAQDLETKRVMLYRNSTDWYGVYPLLWPELEQYRLRSTNLTQP